MLLLIKLYHIEESCGMRLSFIMKYISAKSMWSSIKDREEQQSAFTEVAECLRRIAQISEEHPNGCSF